MQIFIADEQLELDGTALNEEVKRVLKQFIDDPTAFRQEQEKKAKSRPVKMEKKLTKDLQDPEC